MRAIVAMCAPLLLLALIACSPEGKAPESKETTKKVTGSFLSIHGESGLCYVIVQIGPIA
jgi:hypothetical protein